MAYDLNFSSIVYYFTGIERRLDCVNSCNLDRFSCRSVIFDSDGDQCLHFSDKQEGAFSVASDNALTSLTYFEVPVDCGWASDDEVRSLTRFGNALYISANHLMLNYVVSCIVSIRIILCLC